MADNYIVPLDSDGSIPDDIALATDSEGDELLRFGVMIDKTWVKCRYPRWGEWDAYCNSLRGLFSRFGTECDTVMLPEHFGDPEIIRKTFAAWSLVQAAILAQKGMAKEVEALFHKFLKPEVDGVTDIKAWLNEHAPINLPFIMFAALLRPEQWVKKKAITTLIQVFHLSMQLTSNATFTKSSGGAKPKLTEPQPLEFK